MEKIKMKAVLLLIFSVSACAGVNQATQTQANYKYVRDYIRNYEIGDSGPAGGIVFHVIGDGRHGIELVPVSQARAAWGCYSTLAIGELRSEIGTGERNTRDILSSCAEKTTAAALASNYRGLDGNTSG